MKLLFHDLKNCKKITDLSVDSSVIFVVGADGFALAGHETKNNHSGCFLYDSFESILKNCKKITDLSVDSSVIFVVGADGFEPSKSLTTDLQSAPFGHSGTLPYYWSWWTDSNPRPADYKSAALPAELHQQLH